jgi:hypothetical protein
MALLSLVVMPKKTHSVAKRQKAKLLGLGLDNKDGHVWVTRGENFHLVGGSEETHALMQEKAIKLNEHLRRRGKNLDTVSREEFHELADKLGMPLLVKPAHRPN